jgi:hypothetical protein
MKDDKEVSSRLVQVYVIAILPAPPLTAGYLCNSARLNKRAVQEELTVV